MHVQKSLEDLEGLVVEEVERELGGEGEGNEHDDGAEGGYDEDRGVQEVQVDADEGIEKREVMHHGMEWL